MDRGLARHCRQVENKVEGVGLEMSLVLGEEFISNTAGVVRLGIGDR